jgi:hypothetical protein
MWHSFITPMQTASRYRCLLVIWGTPRIINRASLSNARRNRTASKNIDGQSQLTRSSFRGSGRERLDERFADLA